LGFTNYLLLSAASSPFFATGLCGIALRVVAALSFAPHAPVHGKFWATAFALYPCQGAIKRLGLRRESKECKRDCDEKRQHGTFCDCHDVVEIDCNFVLMKESFFY
jgi:hypothetical protein